jgi:hypothetical protein
MSESQLSEDRVQVGARYISFDYGERRVRMQCHCRGSAGAQRRQSVGTCHAALVHRSRDTMATPNPHTFVYMAVCLVRAETDRPKSQHPV